MLINLKKYLFLFYCVFLISCTISPAKKTIDWQENSKKIANLKNFYLKGDFAINSSKFSVSSSLRLEKEKEKMQLDFFDMFGISRLLILQENDDFLIKFAGKTYYKNQAQEFIKNNINITLEIDDVLDIILGNIANASNVKNKNYNDSKKISFKKDYKTWQISYQNYENISGVFLPQKIIIKTKDLELKLADLKWQIND